MKYHYLKIIDKSFLGIDYSNWSFDFYTVSNKIVKILWEKIDETLFALITRNPEAKQHVNMLHDADFHLRWSALVRGLMPKGWYKYYPSSSLNNQINNLLLLAKTYYFINIWFILKIMIDLHTEQGSGNWSPTTRCATADILSPWKTWMADISKASLWIILTVKASFRVWLNSLYKYISTIMHKYDILYTTIEVHTFWKLKGEYLKPASTGTKWIIGVGNLRLIILISTCTMCNNFIHVFFCAKSHSKV